MHVTVSITLTGTAGDHGTGFLWATYSFSLVCPPYRDLESQLFSLPILQLEVVMRLNSHQCDVGGDLLGTWGRHFFPNQKKAHRHTPCLCQLLLLTFNAVCKGLLPVVLQSSCNQEETIKRTVKTPARNSSTIEKHSSPLLYPWYGRTEGISSYTSIIKAIILLRGFSSSVTMSNYDIIKWGINFL